MFSLRGVHVHIGKLHILQGVDMQVEGGESVALLGRDGVGKTTTLRAIMGLARKSRGPIEFDDAELGACRAQHTARKRIGYVPPSRGIFPNLSVLENPRICVHGTPEPGLKNYGFTSFPRLKERRKPTTTTLSGGEQHMRAIARCPMMRPKLII